MIFKKTTLDNSVIIELPSSKDDRGYFSRLYCSDTLKNSDLAFDFRQVSISHNNLKGTLRGLHYQKHPHEEEKIIACISGSIFDVIVDLRIDSNTYNKYFSITLSESDNKLLFVPKGFAHGFLTLEENTKVIYFISNDYLQDFASGVKWDDPTLNINWPNIPITSISDRDKNLPYINEDK